MNYTVQVDAHGNKIVCKDNTPRKGYTVIFTGSWTECQDYRHGVIPAPPQVDAPAQYVVRVGIGGVLFTSIPMAKHHADLTYEIVRLAAPNHYPAIYEVKQ